MERHRPHEPDEPDDWDFERGGTDLNEGRLEFKLENFCKVDRIVSNNLLSLKSIMAEGDRYVRIGCVCN